MKAYNLESALKSPLQVTELYLHNRGLNQLPPAILRLKNLRVLELSSNRFEHIPEAILNLSLLERLNFADNHLAEVPDFLSNLKTLQVLNLSQNRLQEIQLSKFTSLQKLNLSGNQIGHWPLGSQTWPQLQVLNLGANQLRRLPKKLGGFPQLQKLLLDGNGLKQWPDAGPIFPNLRELSLRNNRLLEWPDTAESFPQLEILCLANNRIQVLSAKMGQYRSLQKLDLSYNKIMAIPIEIFQCTRLQMIHLSHNLLTQIPSQIGICRQLRQVELHHNQLQNLPESLFKLPYLRLLNLAQNQFSQLPQGLSQARQLMALKVEKNPLPPILQALLPLDQLKILTTNDAHTKRKQFLRLLAYCRQKQIAPQRRSIYYALWQGDQSIATSQGDLLQALLFPLTKIRQTARQLLLANSKNTVPLEDGVVVSVLGKTHFDLKQLGQDLQNQNIHFSTKPQVQTTHLILGDKPNNIPPLPSKVVFISEQQVFHFLNPKKYLLRASSQEKQNLARLLSSKNAASIGLGIGLLKNGGVPAGLMTAIFIAYRETQQAQQKKDLRAFLILKAGPEMAEILRLSNLLHGKLKQDTFRQRLAHLIQVSGFDRETLEQYFQKNNA